MLTNIIAGVAALLIISGAVTYIIIAKKRGNKCIGCPHSKQCSGGCCGAGKGSENEK